MKLFRKKRFYLILLAPLALLLSKLATLFPWVVEKYYSTTIFSFISRIFGRFWSIFPFSVAEFIIIGIVIGIIVWIVLSVRKFINNKAKRRDTVSSFFATLSAGIGVTFLAFVLLSGINYARPGFAALYSLEPEPSSVEQLSQLCRELVIDINQNAESIHTFSGRMTHSEKDYYALSQKASQGFSNLGKDYPQLSGFTPPTKPVLFSEAMSYAEITGVYFPFTFECNVNVNHPDYAIPFTMMHELAHFKGFMQEEEANFIAYLACEASDNPDFLYSGSLSAFVYAGNALSKVDPELYWEIRDELCQIAKNDLAYESAYWKKYKTPVATISSAINDTYLKINHQELGVKSYGMVVDLLLDHFKTLDRIPKE